MVLVEKVSKLKILIIGFVTIAEKSGRFNKDKSVNIWLKLMRFGDRIGCHQKPERSFFFKGYQFPVCARCTGVIIGEVIAIICLFFLALKWWFSLLFLIPMGIDWGLQYLKILESSNYRRLITGLLGGFGLTYIYYFIIKSIVSLIQMIFV